MPRSHNGARFLTIQPTGNNPTAAAKLQIKMEWMFLWVMHLKWTLVQVRLKPTCRSVVSLDQTGLWLYKQLVWVHPVHAAGVYVTLPLQKKHKEQHNAWSTHSGPEHTWPIINTRLKVHLWLFVEPWHPDQRGTSPRLPSSDAGKAGLQILAARAH